MNKVLVIVGPTAVGKSDLGVYLAKKFNGEIISGDSIQVYKGLDIGSGKVTEEEMDNIPHYNIDVLEPNEKMSVALFQKTARFLINEITTRGKLPIIVGGTGLYIKACLYDYEFLSENDELDYSEFDNYTNEMLYEYLTEHDPKILESIHVNNRKRLLRAAALVKSGSSKSENIENQKHELIYDALIVGCTCERDILHQRINQRVDKMIEKGLESEIKGLLEREITFDDLSMQGIGYKEWKDYFISKTKNLEETINSIKTHSRQFAKRQYTWFNNQMDVKYFDILDDDYLDGVSRYVEDWL